MTEAGKEFCTEWCRSHAHSWQVLNRAQWHYKFKGKTLVRYVEESQMREEEVKLLLEYLSSDDCIKTLCLYDQNISADWKPTRAWLETSNKSIGSLKAVRLFHGLRTNPSSDDDGPYVVEDGCAYKISLTYRWDRESVEDVQESESGVAYKITGIQRDPDTGLYTYAIEKRERVKQDVADYVTQETVFEKRSEEQHIGVKADKVSSTGKAASVADGKIVTRKITKNADCTSDVANTTITEVQAAGASETVSVGLTGTTKTTVNRNMADKAATDSLDVGDRVENVKTDGGRWTQTITKFVKSAAKKIAESCRKTLFEHTHSMTNVQGTDPGFDHSAEASGGKIVEKSVRRTVDGAYQIDENTTEEKGVADSVVTVRKTLRGTVKTTLDRNQQTAAETTGLSVGDEVRVEKTPGGLYNNTKSRLTAENAGNIADSCQTTIFEHTHEKLENVATEPKSKEATAAGEGKTYSKTSRKTDEGSWDVTERTTEEKGVADSVVTVRKTLRGTVKTTLDRNQATAAETTGLSVGDEVRVEKTPGGLYNNTKSGVTAEAAGEIAKSCEDSGAVVHTDVVTKNETSAADITHGEASVNVVKRVTSRRTEEGTYDNETRTTTYKPATTTATTTWPLEKIVTTVVHHNTELNPGAEQGTASASPDDAGAATTTVSEYTPTAFETDWITWTSTTETPAGTSTYKHGIKIFANLSKTDLENIKPSGSDVSISAHVNKYGLLDGVISYSDLTSWTRSSGSSASGGIREGSATFYQYKTDALGRLWQRTATVSTIAYVGSGNEGSEASSRANIKLVSGMSLPYRTYAKSAPTFGNWTKV